MEEIWVERNCDGKHIQKNNIIAYSNTGKIKRRNGEISVTKLRDVIDHTLVYRVIAEKFLPKTDEDISLGRNLIDHISHNPEGMNVNDVRNLRWCTNKENINFSECKKNMSKNHADFSGNKNPMYGRKRIVSEETKQKIKESWIRRKIRG
jgi:hypothetical protein